LVEALVSAVEHSPRRARPYGVVHAARVTVRCTVSGPSAARADAMEKSRGRSRGAVWSSHPSGTATLGKSSRNSNSVRRSPAPYLRASSRPSGEAKYSSRSFSSALAANRAAVS
jgi:hypothetical protein